MIVLTGAAGFIGSCVLAELNKKGHTDLIIVDHLDDPQKERNLADKKYSKFFDKTDFLEAAQKDSISADVSCVIHMGACSSTLLTNREYYQTNNFEYSKVLAEWAIAKGIPFIYASSAATYGDGSQGYADDQKTIRACRPLNLYGESKQDFDLWVLDKGYLDKVVGLKFFNVFGPNEYHKGDMRSVIAKAYDRVVKEKKISLFKSYKPEYADGEQKRDFIYVRDAINVVMFFFEHKDVHGIFNVGTGKARTWNDLAHSLFNAVGISPQIEYIEMPEQMQDKYQYFTEADMNNLRQAGYDQPFTELEDAVRDYSGYLKNKGHM